MIRLPSVAFRVLFFLYKVLLILATPILLLVFFYRLWQKKEEPGHLCERFGTATQPRPRGPLLWIHAASVGESLSCLSLIKLLLKKNPHLHILLTTQTRSSALLMRKRMPQRVIHQFIPCDHPVFVKKFLSFWRPHGVLWLESEFWPIFLTAIRRLHIPSILVNARLSEKSYRGWKRLPFISRHILQQFDLCLAQSPEMASRLRLLGAMHIRMPGNLKFASHPLPVDLNELALFKKNVTTRPIVSFSSTHPGEELLALETHRRLVKSFPSLLTIIAPRHPERRDEIISLFQSHDEPLLLRSFGDLPRKENGFFLFDTLGDLGLVYRLSTVVCMGGSFTPVGGHNPIEPASLENCLVWGPHMENFSWVAQRFEKEGGAVCVSQSTDLPDVITDLLKNPSSRNDVSQRARQIAHAEQDVINRILENILPLFPFLTPMRSENQHHKRS